MSGVVMALCLSKGMAQSPFWPVLFGGTLSGSPERICGDEDEGTCPYRHLGLGIAQSVANTLSKQADHSGIRAHQTVWWTCWGSADRDLRAGLQIPSISMLSGSRFCDCLRAGGV